MAMIDPKQIHALLRDQAPQQIGPGGRRDLKNLLENAGLGPEEILDNLGSLMRTSESEGLRIRAVEMAAKMNGLLQPDEVKQDLTVNIIIQDSQFGEGAINPILIPRAT